MSSSNAWRSGVGDLGAGPRRHISLSQARAVGVDWYRTSITHYSDQYTQLEEKAWYILLFYFPESRSIGVLTSSAGIGAVCTLEPGWVPLRVQGAARCRWPWSLGAGAATGCSCRVSCETCLGLCALEIGWWCCCRVLLPDVYGSAPCALEPECWCRCRVLLQGAAARCQWLCVLWSLGAGAAAGHCPQISFATWGLSWHKVFLSASHMMTHSQYLSVW